MYKARFARLIKVVETTPDERFNMESWQKQTPCGTVGCAAGSYVMAYPKCGLSIVYSMLRDDLGRFGFGAVRAHFDIERTEAYTLFAAQSYHRPSRANVLRRLRAFFKKHS
jgi:hypothetical protein